MKPCSVLAWLTAVGLMLAGGTATAIPVTLNLQGSITGYEFMNLSGIGLPLAAPVSLSLTFNETWSDGTYSFADSVGPVSGSMTAGAQTFVFNNGNPSSYSSNVGGDINWVLPFFSGTGPVLGGGDFFGLFAQFSPALTLLDDLLLGYGFTTSYEGGVSVTNYGYARITATSYSVTPVSVPEPTTLSLLAAGLLLAGVGHAKRRKI